MTPFAHRRIVCGTFGLLLACFAVVNITAIAKAVESDSNKQSQQTEQKPLVVCAVPDAMPRTGRAADGTPQGLDIAVAKLVAAKLGRPLELHWCKSAACSWNCVQNKKCDVVIGQPHGSGPKTIAWSIAYAGSRFGLVVPLDTKGIRSHSDLSGKRVGVVLGTVALASKGHTAIRFKTRSDLLDKFAEQKLDAAFIDDDFAAWYLHQHPDLALKRVAEYVPRERWNMGFAVRAGDTALLKDINRALTHVVTSGQVSKAFANQGISFRAPFSNSAGRPMTYNAWKRIREQGELVISMDPANLPYSSAKPEKPGFDVELAGALARELGVKLRVNWIDIHRETAIGELLDGECDLALGAAVDPDAVDDEEELTGRVIYSRPYYGSGYLLVTRKDGPHVKTLAELTGDKSRRIGTEAGSVADYRLRQRGYLRRLFRTQLSVLKSLNDGVIDYAYLWANVGWTLHATPEFDLEIVPKYVPDDHWNIAIAMRRGDEELKRHVDIAVEKLISNGAVSRALASYHVPYFPPFADVDIKTRAKVSQRPPTDRGLEPDMRRRQRSKKGYGGLDRIHSAGVLVVGLDQKNLPFSTAHPKPAGLDFEIAGLLAKKLDVSLDVYWAYSSHDSYPSKLATKKFCDVILGVMPDDRFASRVLYSKPYYFADYRLVLPIDSKVADKRSPLAVERGVAVRGIGDRQIHEYGDLAALLKAVVEKKEAAGYVISTRSRWLAEKRWPGKLKFVKPAIDATDRFPICVAVRKSDDDLKQAIDRALAELADSGKLADVFRRWHIPYDLPKNQTTQTKK